MQNQQKQSPESHDDAIKKRVREAIRSKGLKIKQFARESGMAYPSLRDYYSGLRKPGFDAIAAIVRFTGVSGDWILLGKGSMFPDQEPKTANVNEDLLAEIAKTVAREYSDLDESDLVRDGDVEDYPYSQARKETQKKLNTVREHALITANVYNRVAHISDDQKREDTLAKEVENLVRFHRKMSKTLLGDDD